MRIQRGLGARPTSTTSPGPRYETWKFDEIIMKTYWPLILKMWQFFETVYEETNSWMMTTENPGRQAMNLCIYLHKNWNLCTTNWQNKKEVWFCKLFLRTQSSPNFPWQQESRSSPVKQLKNSTSMYVLCKLVCFDSVLFIAGRSTLLGRGHYPSFRDLWKAPKLRICTCTFDFR